MAGGEGEDGEHDGSLLTVNAHRVAFNDRLATLEENQLQVQVALDAPHHVVSDDVSVAQVEQRLTLSARSEEHTSELQSRFDLVCRLLLVNKKYVFVADNRLP